MDDNLFGEYTPWDRLIYLEARVQQLEQNIIEVSKAVNIQHQHLVEVNKTLITVQQTMQEIRRWQNQS